MKKGNLTRRRILPAGASASAGVSRGVKQSGQCGARHEKIPGSVSRVSAGDRTQTGLCRSVHEPGNRALHDLGRLDGAIEACRQAIRLEPGCAERTTTWEICCITTGGYGNQSTRAARRFDSGRTMRSRTATSVARWRIWVKWMKCWRRAKRRFASSRICRACLII